MEEFSAPDGEENENEAGPDDTPGGDKPAPKKEEGKAKADAPKPVDTKKDAAPAHSNPEKIEQNLNPKFKDLTISDLEKRLTEKVGNVREVDSVKEIFQELIKRYDASLPTDELPKAISSIDLLSRGLKAGKTVTDGPKGPQTTDKPLPPEARFNYHRAMFGDLDTLNKQVQTRLHFAQYLTSAKQYADAEKMGIEARDKAEVLTKPITVDGAKVSPIDLMKREAKQLVADILHVADPEKRQDMQRASILLAGQDGANQSPIATNKFLAQLYLGTELVPLLNDAAEVVGVKEVKFGQTSAFKPQKAYDAAERARKQTKEILGIDPLDPKSTRENPAVASLFGSLMHVLDNPAKFDLYRDANGDGKPDLIQDHEVENIKKAIRNNCDMTNILIDLGVMALGTAAIALSRNPKVLNAFERNLGRYALNGKLVKGLAAGTAIGGGLAMRHYGYSLLTGSDESWLDSSMHTAGSLASAVVYRTLVNPNSNSKLISEGSKIGRLAAIPTVVAVGAGSLGDELPRNYRFNAMLKKAQQPITNEQLPTQNVDKDERSAKDKTKDKEKEKEKEKKKP